jgi:hypothetical protein
MSQFSQDADWVAVPIAKFSHNTSPYGTRTFTWNHVNDRSDLFLTIRKNQVVDSTGNLAVRVLMLVSGGTIIFVLLASIATQLSLIIRQEEQDLTELVKFCDRFDASTGVDAPVDVVIKTPFLAMKFPKGVHTVFPFLETAIDGH